MIISASRRTDIPAFYSEWFFNRIRERFCAVQNPFNPAQVSRISLSPEDVDAMVFWSKNPAPMLPRLEELDKAGYCYYFQFTLNCYPPELEPGLPPLAERVETFLHLSEALGKRRVVWRYDPIIISNHTSYGWHREKFAELCERLSGKTARLMVSPVEYYKKTARNLAPLEKAGYLFDRQAAERPELNSLLADMAAKAQEHGMEIFSCAQERDYSDIGIQPGSCVDGKLINSLWGLDLPVKKDHGQREFCLCTVSRDIGVSDTCLYGCLYCYATRNSQAAIGRHKRHNPNSAMLYEVEPGK